MNQLSNQNQNKSRNDQIAGHSRNGPKLKKKEKNLILSTNFMCTKITNWYVPSITTLSNNRHVRFDLRNHIQAQKNKVN